MERLRAEEPRSLQEELRAALALSEAPGLGPARVRVLIDRFGSAPAVLEARGSEDLPPTIRRLIRSLRPAPASRLRELGDRGIRLLAYGSGGYPEELRHLHDPPPVLYLRGPVSPPEGRGVAVVGTRRATSYGRRLAGEIASDLAESGWTVVSGLARGIDGAAHAASLRSGGSTIGVLGSGLNFTYPAVHRPLYRRMSEQGLLLSEFTPCTRPAPGLFPRRNRIIAALARAVVVVQAPARSGALITADHALDLGREVLAVPGPVGLEASVGVHRLLAAGAGVATCAADVLEALGEVGRRVAEPGRRASRPGGLPAADSGEEPSRPMLQRLVEGPATADELIRTTDRPVPEALALLAKLELEGILQREPDGRFIRTSGSAVSASGKLERIRL
jgi:DNA processing protein